MELVYLPSTRDDLVWFRHYYESVFPEGRTRAQQQFHAMEALLRTQPRIGHETHSAGVLEFSMPNIPFSVIYRVSATRIEVLRIWDERQGRER